MLSVSCMGWEMFSNRDDCLAPIHLLDTACDIRADNRADLPDQLVYSVPVSSGHPAAPGGYIREDESCRHIVIKGLHYERLESL